MSDQNVQGTIKTRSGTWEWELTSLRAWPKSDVTGKRLGFGRDYALKRSGSRRDFSDPLREEGR